MTSPWRIEQFRPAVPDGRKPCATCYHTLALTNEHSRCHRCRAAGAMLKGPCSECPTEIVISMGRKTCGRACAKARRRRLRRKSST